MPEGAGDAIDVGTGGDGYRFVVDERGQLRQVAFGPGALEAPPPDPAIPRWLFPAAYPAFDEEPRRAPALRVTHTDGVTSTRLTVVDVERATHGSGSTEHTFHLVDGHAHLDVALRFRTWDRDRVIEQWVEVTNREPAAIRLHEVAAAAPSFHAGDSWLTHFGGDWAAEWTVTEERLTLGTKVLESRGGIRPHLQCAPYLLLSPAGASTEQTGTVLAGALAWGGDLRFAAERTVTDQLRLHLGHNHAAGDYVLDPGATFVSPRAVWAWSEAGRGELSRRLHRWVRDHGVRDGHRRRAVVLNTWEAVGFDVAEARLRALAGAGAEVGAELLLVDDGWFGVSHPRDDDTAGLGDWIPDPAKLPGGLEPVIDATLDAGLRFGLWVEPEMVNRRSTLHEQHPGWVVGQPGRHGREERHQLVLDLLQPEVRDHVLATIDGLLVEHPRISYLKWDANRMVTEPGSPALAADRQANLWVDGPLALAAVAAEVAHRHPEVELMLCASGGGRIDLATLARFHEVWLSDNTDPVTRVRMQHAASHFLPAVAVAGHVTRWGERPLAFACAVALGARFGFDLDLATMAADDLATCRRATEVHREIADLVQQGDLWRLVSPEHWDAAAQAHVGDDRRAVVFLHQLGDRDRCPDEVDLPFLAGPGPWPGRSTDLTGGWTPILLDEPRLAWPLEGPLRSRVLVLDTVDT